jgi:hypothetical protein
LTTLPHLIVLAIHLSSDQERRGFGRSLSEFWTGDSEAAPADLMKQRRGIGSASSSFKAAAALMILNAVRLSAQAMSSLPAAHTIRRLCSRLSE